MKKQTGFTLKELVITIGIVGVLLALAIPSFSDMMRRNRLTAINNQVIASVNFARSEAVKRGKTVIVKPKAVNTWESGWSVEVTNCQSDCIIRDYPPLPENYTLRGKLNDEETTPVDSISFFSSGLTEKSGYLILCDTSKGYTPQPDYSRTLLFNVAGHFRTDRNTSSLNSCQ